MSEQLIWTLYKNKIIIFKDINLHLLYFKFFHSLGVKSSNESFEKIIPSSIIVKRGSETIIQQN